MQFANTGDDAKNVNTQNYVRLQPAASTKHEYSWEYIPSAPYIEKQDGSGYDLYEAPLVFRFGDEEPYYPSHGYIKKIIDINLNNPFNPIAGARTDNQTPQKLWQTNIPNKGYARKELQEMAERYRFWKVTRSDISITFTHLGGLQSTTSNPVRFRERRINNETDTLPSTLEKDQGDSEHSFNLTEYKRRLMSTYPEWSGPGPAIAPMSTYGFGQTDATWLDKLPFQTTLHYSYSSDSCQEDPEKPAGTQWEYGAGTGKTVGSTQKWQIWADCPYPEWARPEAGSYVAAQVANMTYKLGVVLSMYVSCTYYIDWRDYGPYNAYAFGIDILPGTITPPPKANFPGSIEVETKKRPKLELEDENENQNESPKDPKGRAS